jgi:hypothetical protein
VTSDKFLVVTPTYFVLEGRNSLQAGSHSLVLLSGDDVTLKLSILLYSVRRANYRLRNARYLHVKARDKSSISTPSGRYVMTSAADNATATLASIRTKASLVRHWTLFYAHVIVHRNKFLYNKTKYMH